MSENARTDSATLHARSNASVRSRALGSIPNTLQAMSSPSTKERRNALDEAVASFDEGLVIRPHDSGWVNPLARTFFSFSSENFSPTRLVWEAVIRGLSVIGSADLDNLGALGEMIAAGDALGVRTTVSLETRTFVSSRPDRVFNCPGQPGVLRALGLGFTDVPSLDCEHGRLIASLPALARERNLALLEKVNPILAPVTLDYERDVLPRTPAGNATWEHVVVAYLAKSREIFPDRDDQAVFWADVMGGSPVDLECALGDDAAFLRAFWEKLRTLHQGDPLPRNYPETEAFFAAVKQAGAIPTLYWNAYLPGLRGDPAAHLDEAASWGARAVAVHPDACWNTADREERELRLAALNDLMTEARRRAMPVIAGSPMNAPGQKFVDAFDAPELAAFFRDFTDSAFWLYGHATLQKAIGLGVGSAWAKKAFPDAAAANEFYVRVGKGAAPAKATRRRLASVCLGEDPDPETVLEALRPLKM